MECSPGARFLYLMLKLIAADQERCGYLGINGRPIPAGNMAKKCHLPEPLYLALMTELRSIGVPAITAEGIYYFPDDVTREAARKVGRKRIKRWREKRYVTRTSLDTDISSSKVVKSVVVFKPPTTEELNNYVTNELKKSIDAEAFVDFYASKGWVVGRSPMRDWRAACRNWIKRDQGGDTNGRGTRGGAKPQPNKYAHLSGMSGAAEIKAE